MKQKELARWIKITIVFIFLMSLFVFLYLVPEYVTTLINNDSTYLAAGFAGRVYIWISVIPFYYALYLVWRICGDISNDDSYSLANVQRLKTISYLAFFEGVYYAIFPFFLLLFFNTAHPGFFLLIFIVFLVCTAFALLAAVLSRLAKKAHDYKEDSELSI